MRHVNYDDVPGFETRSLFVEFPLLDNSYGDTVRIRADRVFEVWPRRGGGCLVMSDGGNSGTEVDESADVVIAKIEGAL